MIFASLTDAYELTETVSITFALLGLAIGGFTYIFNKSKRDYDKDTIRQLTTNNDVLRDQVKQLQADNANLKGEIAGLQNTVTAAPEIAELTKQTAKQHRDAMKLQKQILESMAKIVTGVTH